MKTTRWAIKVRPLYLSLTIPIIIIIIIEYLQCAVYMKIRTAVHYMVT